MNEDSIDRIAAAWTTAKPDLPLESMSVFTRILHIARFYEGTMSRIAQRHDLTLGDIYVLLSLRRAGGPMSVTKLRRELFVTAGAVSKQIDRLSELGYVDRRPVPNDGRAVAIMLTRSGRSLVDRELLSGKIFVFRAPLELSTDERDALIFGLRKLTITLEQNAGDVLRK